MGHLFYQKSHAINLLSFSVSKNLKIMFSVLDVVMYVPKL